MDTAELSVDICSLRLRSTRSKKRKTIEDFDKQLIQLCKREKALSEQKRNLPMVPLSEPYQKGWKRTFVVRDDVKRSGAGAFYEQLLDKINTVQYWNNKSFKKRVKRRRKRQKVYEDIPQTLMKYRPWEWNSPKLKLTAEEKALFQEEEYLIEGSAGVHLRYVFNDSWRYALQVRPHIISEARMVDSLLEQELTEVGNYIKKNHLWYRMYRLTKGRNQTWWKHNDNKYYASPLKSRPLHSILGAIRDEAIDSCTLSNL